MQNLLKNKQKGFTLIELSIVIVIIGILVGGVVLGGKVIDRARLAKFATELSDIHRAVILFQDTYNAFPGDYAGTGSDNGCAAYNSWTTWPNICSGNGDGKIEDYTGATSPNSGTEYIYGRNHLIYEGFLNDSFSNRLSSSSQNMGTFPKSYNLSWQLYSSVNGADLTKSNVNNASDTSIHINKAGTFNGSFARKVDCKIDDCYPTTGVLGNDGNNAANCINGSEYKTDSTGDCTVTYKLVD